MKTARISAIVLLILLGVSAIWGAILLLTQPEDASAPFDLLGNTPFDSFLVPAILLGLFNGLLSLAIALLVILKTRYMAWLVMFQGAVLAVWLTVEILMGIYLAVFTLPYYVIAVLLIICGILLLKKRDDRRQTGH